jgi:eukaryotic-like serine/threonine-protein kinase
MVYGVIDNEGRQLALKVNRPGTVDPNCRARLEQEAALLNQLNSPSIVSFVEAGEDSASGLFCLVVERVAGVPLSEVVSRGETLSPADSLVVLGQLAEALMAIHALGQVLRDLTPAQVLCNRGPRGLKAVLVDLGFARSSSDGTGLTDPASVAGTPGYLAPEMLDASIPTPSADVYSLAAVAYGLLAGVAPFAGLGPEAALAAQYAGIIPPMPVDCAIDSSQRERLDGLLCQALSPDPAARPETPGEFVKGLAAVLTVATSPWFRPWNRR